MQIVIDIPKEVYKSVRDYDGVYAYAVEDYLYEVEWAIKDGTPLPKEHGRIGDLDKLIKAMKERNDDNSGEPLNAVDRGYDLAFQHMIEESKECVIIEADKENQNND